MSPCTLWSAQAAMHANVCAAACLICMLFMCVKLPPPATSAGVESVGAVGLATATCLATVVTLVGPALTLALYARLRFDGGRLYSGTTKPCLHVRALVHDYTIFFPAYPQPNPPLALSWGLVSGGRKRFSTLWGRCPHRPVAMGGSLLSLVASSLR